jgi:hypothetical protein
LLSVNYSDKIEWGFGLAFYDVTHARNRQFPHEPIVGSLSIEICIFAYLFNRANFMLVFCGTQTKGLSGS